MAPPEPFPALIITASEGYVLESRGVGKRPHEESHLRPKPVKTGRDAGAGEVCVRHGMMGTPPRAGGKERAWMAGGASAPPRVHSGSCLSPHPLGALLCLRVRPAALSSA